MIQYDMPTANYPLFNPAIVRKRRKAVNCRLIFPAKMEAKKKKITCLFLCLYFLIKSIKSHISTDTSVWVLFETLHADWLSWQLAVFLIVLQLADCYLTSDELSPLLYTSHCTWLKQLSSLADVTKQNMFSKLKPYLQVPGNVIWQQLNLVPMKYSSPFFFIILKKKKKGKKI